MAPLLPSQLPLPGIGNARPKHVIPQPDRLAGSGRRGAKPTLSPTSTVREATLDGQTVHYTVKRSPKARHLRIEISPVNGLRVVVPRRCAPDLVERFLQHKRRWVLDRMARLRREQRPSVRNTIESGDMIPYLGRSLEIVFKESHEGNAKVSLDGDRLMVCTIPEASKVRLAVEMWYRVESETLIKTKAESLARRLGVKYNRITMRSQKTRWGSCSKLGNLNFNWRLLMAPEPVIDYVVIHELAHLKEMNHSSRFWAVVEANCPGWAEHRNWLRHNQSDLMVR